MRGRCFCGLVAFELVEIIPRFYQCHCSNCRKPGGSGWDRATIISTDNFRWLSPEEHITYWDKRAGFRFGVCSKCGCRLPHLFRDDPYYWVPMGLLDDTQELEIVAHLFVSSKGAENSIPPQGVHYEGMPMFSELVALLHGGNDA